MKSSHTLSKKLFGGLFAAMLGLCSASAAHADIENLVLTESQATLTLTLDGTSLGSWTLTSPEVFTGPGEDSNGNFAQMAPDGLLFQDPLNPGNYSDLGFNRFQEDLTPAQVSGYLAVYADANNTIAYSDAPGTGSGAEVYYDGNDIDVNVTVQGPEDAPEPSTYALLLGGLGLLAFWHRRTRHALI